MFHSLRWRLSAIFVGFLLLVAASVAATVYVIETQSRSDQVSVAGCAPTPRAAAALIAAQQPDAVIIAGADRVGAADYGHLLTVQPDLPIIRADLNADSVQVITSHRIGIRPADLLTALAELPKRR